MIDLVRVNLQGTGYYSEAEYEDNIWIKKSSYEKLKDVFPSEGYCGDLDGKYGETMGDISVIEGECLTDEDYAKNAIVQCDGDLLKYQLNDLYFENGLDFEQEQKEIAEYFNTLDAWEEVTVKVPRSKKSKLLNYAYRLQNKTDEEPTYILVDGKLVSANKPRYVLKEIKGMELM